MYTALDGLVFVPEFASTAQVVEDMIAIIERHGEWREAEAYRELKRHSREEGWNAAEVDRVRERTKWRHGAEKINYWGYSYGTLLGQTFATMHPDRISRMVIDGVVDAADYYRGDWLTNLQDTDQT